MTTSKNVLLVTSAAPAQSPFSTTEKRPPIGLGYLISVLRNCGHQVFFIDNYLNPSNFLEGDYLERNRIDIVGIYANTVCFRDTLRMAYRLEYLRQTRRWCGKIMVGGPHVSVAVETIPAFVDHVVVGEGERAVVDIVEGKATDRVLRYAPLKELDDLPMPAWDYFVHQPYDWSCQLLEVSPVFTMNTSRGCPFNCTFCSVGSIWGKRYSFFSAERIVAEIKALQKDYGLRGVYFREDNFTLHKQRLVSFCDLLMKEGLDIQWACESRVDTLDRGVLSLMKAAGCRGLYFGVESGSQRVLDFLKKGLFTQQIINTFRLCRELGLKTAASYIVGIPGETEEDFELTQRLLAEIAPSVSWANVFVGIPKSELYHHVLQHGLHEFIDDRGLIYLKGHDQRVRSFYGGGWDASVPVRLEGGKITAPTISVVMAAYNAEAHLAQAVASILAQTYADFEFIVIDDASTDSTLSILQSYGDPRIRIIRNEVNMGLTASLNRGIEAASGKFVARMDADDVSLPHRFEVQVALLERNPSIAAVGSSYYVIDERGQTMALTSVLTDPQTIKEELMKQNWFGHGSVMLRKSCLDEVGGYDEAFHYSQDYDLFLRLSEKFQLANIAEPLYLWRSSPRGISTAHVEAQKSCAEKARQSAMLRRGETPGACLAATTSQGTGHGNGKCLVSVIIPTFNRLDMLKASIESVLAQTLQDFEIIVVNDAGADVSAVVHSFACPIISYVTHEINRGLAATRNTGLRLAKGKYIAYLDDDDIYYPDHLQTLVQFMESGGQKVAYTDACRAHQLYQTDGSYLVAKRDVPYSEDFDYKKILVGNFIPVLCVMHTADCVIEAGGFDEDLGTHEDWDLWIRLSRKFSFHHIKKVTCEFRWRQDGSSMTSSRELNFISTQEKIYRKYRSVSREIREVFEQQKLSLLARKKRAESLVSINCSIVIPAYNQVQLTARCLETLYDVTSFANGFEVIVIDNGSTDETGAYLKRAREHYPNLRVVTNVDNVFFARACNQGAEVARGDVLVFLNNDTEPEQQWLEPLIEPLAQEQIGMVGAKLLFPDRTLQHGGMVFVSCGAGADSVFSIHRFRGVAEDDPRVNQPEEVQAVTGACVAIRKELFSSVGGFCEDYGMYYEDVDLCLKVWKAGKKIFYEPRSVLLHHEGKSSASHEVAKALDAKARSVFLKKWGPELPALAQVDVSVTSGKVLWLRPDSIGDSVLAAAMLMHVKREYPEASIVAVCQTHVSELLEASPFVDGIIAFDRMKAYRDEPYRDFVLKKLQAERADVALYSVFSRDPLYDFFAIGCGAKERIALHGDLSNIQAEIRNENNGCFTRLLPSEGEWKPELARHRDFLKGLGIDAPALEPVVWTTAADEAFADTFFSRNGLDPHGTIALFAGAQSALRTYPHYGRALAPICQNGGFQVVAFGTANEFQLNQENLDDCGVRGINTSGTLSLRQTAAILKRCRLAVGAETGTAHIACAMKVPNVVLVGGGHFGRFMPYSPLTSVVCLPLHCYCCNWRCSCHRPHCVKDLHPAVIREALRQTLLGLSEEIRVFCQSSAAWLPMAGEPAWQGCDHLLTHYPVRILQVGTGMEYPEAADAAGTDTPSAFAAI